jgi:hypothetical protein
MTTEIEQLNGIISPLIGQSAWNVQLGWSSFITLEFGAPQTNRGNTRGAWHLWVYGAGWRLEEGDRMLAGSLDDDEHLTLAVKRMDGLKLLAVDIDLPMLDTVFTFEQDVVLRLFSEYTSSMEHWMLFLPDDNVLSLGPGTTWSIRPASELPASAPT